MRQDTMSIVSVVSLPDTTCRIPSDDCLTSPMVLATNAFIYFKQYEEDKQFLTYPSAKLVETVNGSVTVLESKMAQVAHMGSDEEMITVTIHEVFDF